MYIYILTFLITIALVWIAQNKIKNKKLKILLLLIAVIPMFLVSAFRYDIGTDYTKRYVADYNTLAKGKDVKNLEIGFKTIDYLCLFFTKEPYLLFVITSLIILAIIFEVIYKKSNNILLSIAIFFLGGYFFGSLNLVRQYIAISLILLGYQFLMNENKKKAYIGFVICAILAFLMHSSSIICFIIIFLTRKNLINIKWVIPISVLILLVNQNIMNVITPILQNTRFKIYLDSKHLYGELSILQIAENLIIYLWMNYIYYSQKDIKNNKEKILFLNIQGLSLLFTIAGVIHYQFMRISVYFSAFQILSIPYYLKIMKFENITIKINNKLKKNFKVSTIKIIVYVCFCLAFTGLFTYTNILNNDNEVLPYKTVFSIKNSKGK